VSLYSYLFLKGKGEVHAGSVRAAEELLASREMLRKHTLGVKEVKWGGNVLGGVTLSRALGLRW